VAPLRFDTQLTAPLGEEDRAARRLAETGFDGAFTFEGPHDVFFPLVTAARAGVDLDLMTNVAIALPRSPVHLAHAAWDLQSLSGGRFRLGLGTQVRTHIERRYGSTWSHPVEQLEDCVAAIKAIFAAWQDGTRLNFRGRYTSHTLMTPTFNPGPNPHGPPPVLVGALGPRMTEMAARVADGVLLMPFNSRRHYEERTLPAVRRGLAATGRSSSDVELVAEVIVACGRTEEELATAEAGVRSLLSFYGSTPAYAPVLDVEGWGDLQPELNRLSKEGRWGDMAGLIEPEVLATLAVRGSPADCARQINERVGDFASRVAFYFPYAVGDGVPAELLDALRR
jgi:probable F420-dependent oxidoreductase